MHSPEDRSNSLERWFVVVALVLFSHGYFTFLYDDLDAAIDPSETRPLNQAIFIAVYLVTAIAAFRWRRPILKAIRNTSWVWALVGLATVSIAWSAAPDVTIRRSVALIATTFFGTYLGVRFSVRQQLQLLLWAAVWLAVGSLLTALFLPDYGVVQVTHIGAWRGVFGEKNTLGRFAAFSLILIACYYGAARTRGRVWHLWIFAALLVFLLGMSGSATAVSVAFIFLLLWPLIYILRGNGTLAMSLFFFAAVAVLGTTVTFLELSDPILNSLGRDTTLTGRTGLWTVVLEDIYERPLLGYGFGSFWLGLNGPSAGVWALTGFATPHSHNGLLDLLLDVGGFGAMVFLLSYSSGLARALNHMRAEPDSVNVWPFAFLVFMALYNITESSILRQNSIYWITYVSALTTVLQARPLVQTDLPFASRRGLGCRPLVMTHAISGPVSVSAR